MSRFPLQRAGAALVAAAFLSACGHPEKVVVDKYFQAVNAKDNQTLASFALVGFDKKVDRVVINKTSSETKEKVPLPELVKKRKDIEAQIADNKKKYNSYFLDNMKEVDEFKDVRKSGGKVPAKLTKVASDWEAFEQTEKDLKRQLDTARRSADREKSTMILSVGPVDDIESLDGEVITKQLDLDLVVEGQPQKYLMTVKRYDVKPASGVGKVISRWIVSGLQKA
jgi:hypothetical protein